MSQQQIKYKPHLFAKARTITIDDNRIVILKNGKVLKDFEFDKNTEIRYGLIENVGVFLIVGYFLKIELKSPNEKKLCLKFTSLYRFGLKKSIGQHNAILDLLEPLMRRNIEEIIKILDVEERVCISGTYVSNQGIELFPSKSKTRIDWHDVNFVAYQFNFTISSKTTNPNLHRTFSYLEDWNAVLLYILVSSRLQSQTP